MTSIRGDTENRGKKIRSDPKILQGRVVEQFAAILRGSSGDWILKLKV
jgi:hypothetical protein